MTPEPERENPAPSAAPAGGGGGESAPPRRRTLAEEIVAREIAARAAASAGGGQVGSKPTSQIKATAVFRPIRFVKPAGEKPSAPPPPAPTTAAIPVPAEEPKAIATAPSPPAAAPAEEKLPPPAPLLPIKSENVVAPPVVPVKESSVVAAPSANIPAAAPKATKVSMVFRPKGGAGTPPPPVAPPPIMAPAAAPAPIAGPETVASPEAEAAPISAAPKSVATSDAGAHPAATAASVPASESSVAAAHRILVAARLGAAAAEAHGAKQSAETAELANGAANAPASEAVANPSGWPAFVRASAMVFRRSAMALIILGGGYYATRTWVMPMIDELRHPGKTDAIHDKAAPTAVRVLQQTRQVVAQNDARVDYLNSVVDQVDGKARQPAAPPTPPPAVAPAAVAAPAPVALTADAYRSGVDRLKIAGVYAGEDPRINLDGRLVKYGEIVDRDLGLRFIGIDPVEHVILFSNADNVTFKKIY